LEDPSVIDPRNVTDYRRTDAQLQEFLIYAVCVAGKKAADTAPAVARLLNLLAYGNPAGGKGCSLPPLSLVALYGRDEVARAVRQAGMGCYRQKARALHAAARRWRLGLLDLRTCSAAELECLPCVGPKTARFFLLHSRPGVRAAAIDRHILRHLAAHGVRVPTQTPARPASYRRLEDAFLRLADEADMTPADYDLAVWKRYAVA
jgi:endonuclease III